MHSVSNGGLWKVSGRLQHCYVCACQEFKGSSDQIDPGQPECRQGGLVR